MLLSRRVGGRVGGRPPRKVPAAQPIEYAVRMVAARVSMTTGGEAAVGLVEPAALSAGGLPGRRPWARRVRGGFTMDLYQKAFDRPEYPDRCAHGLPSQGHTLPDSRRVSRWCVLVRETPSVRDRVCERERETALRCASAGIRPTTELVLWCRNRGHFTIWNQNPLFGASQVAQVRRKQ